MSFSSPDPSYDVTFNGIGTFNLSDVFTVIKPVRLVRGAFNTNNYNCFWGGFTDYGAFPIPQKNLNLGSSTLSINGSWNYQDGNLNAGTSHIIMLLPGYNFSARYNTIVHTYYDVTFNNVGALYGGIGTRFHNVLFQSNATIGSISGT